MQGSRGEPEEPSGVTGERATSKLALRVGVLPPFASAIMAQTSPAETEPRGGGTFMAVQRNATIERQTVILDGNEYHGCTFDHCNLIYKAHDAVKLEHCHIVGCT